MMGRQSKCFCFPRMNNLSSAARAVLDAYNSRWDNDLAAALRAAVAHTQQHRGHDVWECDADELLAITAELEGAND